MRDPQVAVRGRRGTGHQVRTPPVDDDAARGLGWTDRPDLLDRGREEGDGVDTGTLCGAVDLLDQPGGRRAGRRSIALRQRQLIRPRAPVRQDVVEGDRLAKRRCGGDPDAPADMAARSADEDPGDGARRRHDQSSVKSSGSA